MAKKNKLYAECKADIETAGYSFRINDLDESLEIKTPDDLWAEVNDTNNDVFEVAMRELGYGTRKKPSLSALKACVTKLAHENRYHPIKDYFHSLTGKYEPNTMTGPYRVQMLCDHIEDDGTLETWLHRWMIGTIAKVFKGERNPMLVLISEQRKGKSTLVEWLCPFEALFKRGDLRPDATDHKIALISNFMWEVDELGGTTRRRDAEATKSFITLSEVKERLPYGKKPIRKPAITNFVGSVNFDGAGFLVDPTGHTRFLCSEIHHINFDYSTNIDPDDLWAEAWWYYNHVPNSWRLTPAEEKLQAETNAKYEVTSALEDVIEATFDITKDESDFLTTQAIKGDIGTAYHASAQVLHNDLFRTLNKLGCWRGRQPHSQGGLRGWHGIKAKPTINLNDDV